MEESGFIIQPADDQLRNPLGLSVTMTATAAILQCTLSLQHRPWFWTAAAFVCKPALQATPTYQHTSSFNTQSAAASASCHNTRAFSLACAPMPSAAEVKSLFRAYLRVGRHFPNYNIRNYITRRAKEEFHALAKNADAAAAEATWQKAQQELEVWKRQSVVYQLYGRRIKTVLELDAAAAGRH